MRVLTVIVSATKLAVGVEFDVRFLLRWPRGRIRSGLPKGGLMLNSDLSPAAPQGGREPPTDKTRVVSTRRRVHTSWVSVRTLQPSIESVVATSFVSSDFLVSGLGKVPPSHFNLL